MGVPEEKLAQWKKSLGLMQDLSEAGKKQGKSFGNSAEDTRRLADSLDKIPGIAKNVMEGLNNMASTSLAAVLGSEFFGELLNQSRGVGGNMNQMWDSWSTHAISKIRNVGQALRGEFEFNAPPIPS